ncbi:hypothetical protein CfE428DRAFT_6013 [Chthoniobacter flavus Ellin428]|uniref:Uncharacterized protein n=1 Tax=Chthoniobacter flavus Ellin428 TaxID=497964 RepID=B4DAS2_9BACT|nr:hypothetical protein CfE428DRAFT_6013 [Chthoniobacter flavus Ellin428]
MPVGNKAIPASEILPNLSMQSAYGTRTNSLASLSLVIRSSS